MKWKEFFKLSTFKLIFTILLSMAFYFYLFNSPLSVACPEMVGYDCSKEIEEAHNLRTKTSFIIGTISILFWYLTSCISQNVFKKLFP